jgi:hypothetical protein
VHRLTRHSIFVASLIASGFVSFSASSTTSGPVTVTLSPPPNSQDAERGVIQVSIRNEGSRPIYMFGPITLAHQVFVNVLCIRDAAGGVAEHRINPGKLIWSPAIFTRIDPHRELRNTVDLDYVYALPDGPVDITYSPQPFFERPQGDPEPSDAAAGETRSNSLHVWVNRSLLRPASEHPYWGHEISKNPDCEPRTQAR